MQRQARFEAAREQDLVEQVIQFVQVAHEFCAPVRIDAVGLQFETEADPGERGSQFVARIGQQLPVRVEQVRDTRGSHIEAARERGDFVVSFHRRTPREIAVPERTHRVVQSIESPAHASRERIRTRADQHREDDQRERSAEHAEFFPAVAHGHAGDQVQQQRP